MRVATNIFNNPENTGPGNFGRRLAVALESLGVQLVPVFMGQDAPVFLGSAFLDGALAHQKKVLRVDGLGAGGDIPRVETAHKHADVVVYQSTYSRNVLQQKHQFTPNESTVICNGVPLPSVWVRNHIVKGEGFRLISIVHNWNKYRYPVFMDVMVKNADKIRRRYPQVEWQVIGKSAEFREAIGDNIPSFMKFIEFTPDLDVWRNSAHACLHLVDGDSCPNSVVESLAHGLPCIVWHASAGPQLIDYGEAGAIVSGTNPESILAAIGHVMGYHQRMSAYARDIAERKWNISVIAQQYKEVFENVLRT